MSLSVTITIPLEAAAALCHVLDESGDPRTLLDDASIYAAFQQVIKAVKASPHDLRRLATEKHSEPPPSPTITSLSSGWSTPMLTPSSTSCAPTESNHTDLERPTPPENFLVLMAIDNLFGGSGHIHAIDIMRSGMKYLVQANGLMTVEELRVALMNQEDIPAHRQRLIYSGKELEDDRTLQSVCCSPLNEDELATDL